MFKRVKSFFKEEWKFLIFLLVIYFGFTYEFPYVIYTPGGSINMSERIKGDNIYDEAGSISMTYVSMVRGSAPFLLVASVLPNWDIVSSSKITYDDVDVDETIEIDKIYMQEAISNAKYVAYTHAGIDFKETGVHNLITYISSEALTNLKSKDEIISVDGIKYTTLTEFQEYITSKNVGDKVSIKYLRNNKEYVDEVTLIEIDGLAKVGLSIVTLYDYETDYNIDVETKSSESGPSGGLMTSLAIYNRITSTDITKGRTIMGTGTIDRDGQVGEIGGVKYKLLGANKANADIFLCPMDNYEEALKVKNENNLDIIVIGVNTFEEAIEALK